MRIRRIRSGDYDAVDRLLLQLHQLDVEGRPELFVQLNHFMTRESFLSLIHGRDNICLLAEERGRVLGCCFVSMLSRSGMVSMKIAYLDLIVVEEAFRRQGIGRALFREIRRRVVGAGAERLDLTVWSHNPEAIHAYRSYGMVPQHYIYEIPLSETPG